jgi:hypothetical protein
MTIKRPWVKGLMYVLLPLTLCFQGTGEATAACASDSLALQKIENLSVWKVYDPVRKDFVVYLTFKDVPDSCATYLHQPDTTGWAVSTPSAQLSLPVTRGTYTGDIDRTIGFDVDGAGGTVGGATDIVIQYAIEREDHWHNDINVGSGYTPGEWIPLIFKTTWRDTLDLGIEIAFPAGEVDEYGGFKVGCEDFEGFHFWRGLEPDGSDLTIIGELSKEEAFVGIGPGGNMVDSVYFYWIIPALRETGVFVAPFSMDCLGYRIDMDLEDNELMWFDCNAFNGFTYYYGVTTFDRDYEVYSGRQGLVKFDRCQPGGQMPLPDSCLTELYTLPVDVDTQDNLYRVYAVPNPYRTGGSRLTTQNYHNFPDEMIRFVNVPENCSIKIYTVSGDLVWESEHHSLAGNIQWDTRNRGGEEVTSGVYIYRIEDLNGNQVFGRLVVIR